LDTSRVIARPVAAPAVLQEASVEVVDIKVAEPA
jgi:hypothetical protein